MENLFTQSFSPLLVVCRELLLYFYVVDPPTENSFIQSGTNAGESRNNLIDIILLSSKKK